MCKWAPFTLSEHSESTRGICPKRNLKTQVSSLPCCIYIGLLGTFALDLFGWLCVLLVNGASLTCQPERVLTLRPINNRGNGSFPNSSGVLRCLARSCVLYPFGHGSTRAFLECLQRRTTRTYQCRKARENTYHDTDQHVTSTRRHQQL